VNPPLDFTAIRLEVARRHSLLLDDTDPVLVTVTLSELVLQHYLELARSASEDAERASAGRIAQEVERVKATAERMIVGASEVIAARVSEAGQAAQAQVLDALAQRLAAAEAATASAVRARTTAMIAAGVAVGATLLVLGAALGSALR